MNQPFPIKSKVAQKVWHNFERDLVHKLAPLPKDEGNDIRLEIMSHLYESASHDEADLEEVRFINAIERLGSPEEYLDPLIADILLTQQTIKGDPRAIYQSLLASARKGFFHNLATLVLGLGYFWVIMIFIMSVMHLGDPDVGIWYYPSGNFSLSFSAQPDAIQWQPKWFPLIGIITSASAYWLLNKLLSYLFAKSK
ncbi:hypothetical protein [Thalassotalea sp. ND16A]|uniref:hypothetical protein n=1 Tax=Thalassotalea sp. ND16A TaxID=1535422 RepID=UPI00051A2B51|nr:hypothetical protein [Thalassotalea sp. ND16A]KGJ91948.1 hypothetical protein ND16A_1788 [Thalassotalea sp. ND16A]